MGELDDCLCLCAWDYQQLYLHPPSLRDTVHQAILDHEVWGWVWWWLDLFPLNHSHLLPAVLHPIIPELLLHKISPTPHLLEHIIEKVRTLGGGTHHLGRCPKPGGQGAVGDLG